MDGWHFHFTRQTFSHYCNWLKKSKAITHGFNDQGIKVNDVYCSHTKMRKVYTHVQTFV